MASAASDLLAHFKLEAEISPTHTSHISYRNDHARGRRKEKVEKRWYKDKVLGHGSFGEVCLEVCRQGDNIVDTRAVKRIEKVKMRSWEVDYERELLALAKFSKLQDKEEDVLVKFFGYFENADAVFLAMEYFSYGDLAQYLESPLSEPEIKQITRDVVEGLRIMHAEGFAHRDLKPKNIFVAKKFPGPWWVKIGDFGMAKRDGEQTDLRTWGGTPHYQAPEFNGFVEELEETSIHTNAVDMWSLGCVVYSLATKGAVPFPTALAVNRFCNGKLAFPDKALSMKLTSSGIQFVKDLLVRLPSERLTAETAQHAPWLRKGHESFISPSHPTALSQHQSGVAKLPHPAPIDCMVTNSTQDAAPFLLPKHPKTFATGGNSTARPSKDQKLDQLRVEPTNVCSESSDAWRRSPKSYHAMEENLIGKDNGKERSEEGGEERDGDTVSELSTDDTRDHERLSITPLRRTVLPPISVSLQEAERREATRLLRDAGFDFDAPNYRPKSACFWAAKHGYKAVTLLLLEKGADIEVKDNNGWTALHYAACNGHEAVICLLLDKGADIRARSQWGWTAAELAAKGGHENFLPTVSTKNSIARPQPTSRRASTNHSTFALTTLFVFSFSSNDFETLAQSSLCLRSVTSRRHRFCCISLSAR
ncbi:MAG: CAMK kinase [Lasallia pustulata]|uniref:CAMK kinase n=1 Tax=Lasallia pustulata TaxID=136370 RepID=A0A5M8PV00_9LECA|nr:MAG: CAMK kinase [Lasallia pustulata]